MTFKTLPQGTPISFVDAVNGENVPTSHIDITSYYVPSNSDFEATDIEDRQSLNFNS